MNSIELLARLLAFDTVSRNPNRALIDDVAGLLRGAGLDPVLIPDASGTKANLLVTVGPRDRAGVLASGHTDVVPVDGQAWSVPPRDEQPSLHSWPASAKWARSCEPGPVADLARLRQHPLPSPALDRRAGAWGQVADARGLGP